MCVFHLTDLNHIKVRLVEVHIPGVHSINWVVQSGVVCDGEIIELCLVVPRQKKLKISVAVSEHKSRGIDLPGPKFF